MTTVPSIHRVLKNKLYPAARNQRETAQFIGYLTRRRWGGNHGNHGNKQHPTQNKVCSVRRRSKSKRCEVPTEKLQQCTPTKQCIYAWNLGYCTACYQSHYATLTSKQEFSFGTHWLSTNQPLPISCQPTNLFPFHFDFEYVGYTTILSKLCL